MQPARKSEATPADWDVPPIKHLTGDNFAAATSNPAWHLLVLFCAFVSCVACLTPRRPRAVRRDVPGAGERVLPSSPPQHARAALESIAANSTLDLAFGRVWAWLLVPVVTRRSSTLTPTTWSTSMSHRRRCPC